MTIDQNIRFYISVTSLKLCIPEWGPVKTFLTKKMFVKERIQRVIQIRLASFARKTKILKVSAKFIHIPKTRYK